MTFQAGLLRVEAVFNVLFIRKLKELESKSSSEFSSERPRGLEISVAWVADPHGWRGGSEVGGTHLPRKSATVSWRVSAGGLARRHRVWSK